jgi:hypothetical protein
MTDDPTLIQSKSRGESVVFTVSQSLMVMEEWSQRLYSEGRRKRRGVTCVVRMQVLDSDQATRHMSQIVLDVPSISLPCLCNARNPDAPMLVVALLSTGNNYVVCQAP